MHSADIRSSRTLTLGFNKKDLDYDAEANFISNKYNADSTSKLNNEVDLKTFSELSLHPNNLVHRSSIDSQAKKDDVFQSRFNEHTNGEQSEQEEDEQSQLPSATADAMETYINITENIYCGSATGKTIAEESMPCECKYQPDIDDPDAACGDDNHCINRMMFMECTAEDCACGRYCRNRRFQLRQYARVDVIRTEKKGFGLRALTDLPTNSFIMEYIGEVIPNHEFIRRTKEYEASGLQHYYFMTLKTDEIIDATRKGCLARFINHSCNPNCVTQKWVVGKNMRIGIFTNRFIKAGEELTFDYKFERYGAQAQVCYCGEPVCKGFIGGSFKNNESTVADDSYKNKKNKNNRSEEDDDDDDDDDSDDGDDKEDSDSDIEEAVTLTQKRMLKKWNRRKSCQPLKNPDEVKSFVKRMLDSVGKSHLVMRLLRRLELTNKGTALGKEVLKRFIRLHGLKMLKFWLGEWKNDRDILIRVLHVLSQLPLANRNGLEDCKMFDVVEKYADCEDEEISSIAKQLLEDWQQLKSVYRIPKRNPMELDQPSNDKISVNGAEESENTTDSRIISRFESSREFFDPDDDYFEYFSIDATEDELRWKLEYPPRCAIPTAPRAMMDAYAKNGYYGYGRHSRASTSYYPPASFYNSDFHHDTEQVLPNTTFNNNYNIHHRSKSGDSYLQFNDAQSIDSASVMSSNSPSKKLPPNWRFAFAEDGTIYYYHRYTGKTQWNFPEEKASHIEGVNQSDLESLVEKTVQDAEKKKTESIRLDSPASSFTSRHGIKSPQVTTPTTTSRRGSGEVENGTALSEIELKKAVGKIVTKYLSSKQKELWKDDKHLFKELARKITHHIVDREVQSSRKIQAINSNIRTKIEKFIDSHGAEIVTKIFRKRKHQSLPTASKEVQPIQPIGSPKSIMSEDIHKYPKDAFSPYASPSNHTILSTSENGTDWQYEDPSSPPTKKRMSMLSGPSQSSIGAESLFKDEQHPISDHHDEDNVMKTTNDGKKVSYIPQEDSYSYQSRETMSNGRPKVYSEPNRCSREYVRPGYVKIMTSGTYRYVSPSSASTYYKSSSSSSSNSRYYPGRKPSPTYYHRHSASSSRRNSLSDDDLDRRRRN